MSPLLLLALQASADFRQAPAVVETTRIALTPRLDGKIEEEEWDHLGTSEETKTFLQWEPGTIHVAAAAAAGKDILVSIDPGGDGWLVGANNLEARIGVREGKPFLRLRLLDATNVAGPTYRTIPNFELASKVVVGEDGTIEATLADAGLGLLPAKSGKFAARIDLVSAETPDVAPNEPRALSVMTLADSRATALPTGLESKVSFNDIPVIPGENLGIRFDFSGEPMPKRIAMRSEGLSRESTSAEELPFPAAGKRGAKIEYKTRIQPDALTGYRIARATITGADGIPSVIQASYRIAQPVDVVLSDPHLKPSDRDRSIRLGYHFFGNSKGRLSGGVNIAVPGDFRIVNGDDALKLSLFEPRRGLRKTMELFVPANSLGTVPIRFTLEMNGKKFEVVKYLTID